MNVPVYRTWVAGEVVTAAYFNSNVRDAGNFWLSVPTCEARQTVAESMPNGAAQGITMDTNDFDNDGGHSTVTNTSRYTFKTQGRFQVSGGISYVANATGSRHAEIWKNGSVVNGGGVALGTNPSGVSHRMATRTMTLFANGSTDYVEIVGFQNSGAALNTAVTANLEQPTMSVRFVGAS